MTTDAMTTDDGKAASANSLPGAPGKVAVGYLALAVPAMAIAGDSVVALARGWEVESRADRALLTLVGLGLVLITAALCFPAGRRFFANKFAQLIALSVSVCGAIVLLELVAGPILARLDDPFHLRQPGLEVVYHPEPRTMRDVGPEARAKYNSWGSRGSEPPPRDRAYRILCLGGSSTACTYLDDSKTWPQRLQSHLRAGEPSETTRGVWVANAGRPAYRSREHRRFVEDSPLVGQVDCIVVQAGFNDLTSCLAGYRPPPIWTHSAVWIPARRVARRALTETVVEDDAGQMYQRRRARRQAAEIDDSPPDIDKCLDEFADNVRRIIEACRERGVRIVFTTQPALYRVDLDDENAKLLWFGQLPDGRYLSVAELRAALDRYNDTLGQVCRQHGAELVDLGEFDGDPAIFYDDCHFTETGADRLARRLADWFSEHPDSKRRQPRS